MRRALALLLVAALAGCGFQLRDSAHLPFDTVYLPAASGGIALDLKRNIQAGTNAKVVNDPKKAEAVLEFSREERQKVILSLTGTGAVSEYQLRYVVSFRVRDTQGGDYVPQSTIQLTRDVTFNNNAVLAAESQDQLLYHDMQIDMVQQIMRRIAAAKPPKA